MKDIKVIKRDGRKVDFDATKIRTAIGKANAEVPPVVQLSSIQMDAVTEMVVNQIFENRMDFSFFLCEIQFSGKKKCFYLHPEKCVIFNFSHE